MKKGLFFATVAMLAVTSMSASSAEAAKPRDLVAPLSVSAGHAGDPEALSALWIDGRRQELNGQSQVEDGTKLIRKAEKDERKASAKLAKMTAISEEQRAAYVRLVNGFGGASTPAAVETEIKALKKAADDWKDAYERVVKADAAMKDAQLAIANGQSATRTGNELIAAGREKMQRAENESNPDYVRQMELQKSNPSIEFVEMN